MQDSTIRMVRSDARASKPMLPPTPAEPNGEGGTESWDMFVHPGTPDMVRMLEQIRLVAPQETNVLLEGETGTGKTRLARLIHDLSPRRSQPYLAVNCGALADNLIESEMFGHVKGSFTGADRDRVGKFSEVGRGTLLLDDIDALPLTLQAKLLRAVEERVFEPVGSNSPQPMLARLIAASSRTLEREVSAGRFRADLFFRLNVVSFSLPPLRDRRTAIRPLAFRFVSEYAARNRREVRGISPEAMRVLEGYDWPGNIRELRNTIERAVSLCAGREVQVFDLPDSVRTEGQGEGAATGLRTFVPTARPAKSPLAQIKEAAEVTRIIEALERHKDNRLRAARELGISRMTLYKKLHKYGLMGPSESTGPGSRRKLSQSAGGTSLG